MKDIRFAKFVVLVNGLVPGTILVWDWMHGHAGANPVNYAILTTGLLTLIFLTLTLLVTPLRKITGFSWLYHFRRSLGLFAFFYSLMHFSIFFLFDRAMSVSSTVSEIFKRPYLVIGSLGILSMAPLAITSTNGMIKRLGSARWRKLHRLVYLTAILGVVHFYMQVKSDIRMPVAFGIAIAILLGYRIWARETTAPKESAGPAPDSGRWSGQLRVQRISQETHNVRTFRLASPDGGEFPFKYLPGQYLTFSHRIDGKPVKRSYTIASTPSREGFCEVTIKREPMGLGSRHMHDAVKEGDLLTISAPGGRFTFDGAESKSVALIGAGVGITPLMSMLRCLIDRKWDGKIYLAFCNRTEGDIIFRKEIEDLQRQFPNLHVKLTLTDADGSGWQGATGRIDAAMLKAFIPELSNLPCYICGPAPMLDSTTALLRELGVAESNIRKESFGPRPAPGQAPGASGTEFAVTFERSNKTAPIGFAQPILDLAEKLGIDWDSECRSGICGRCKCRLISGSVEMETQEALDAADRENNFILLCQAHALENVTVDA